MVNVIFSAAPANVTINRTNLAVAGGAAWTTNPPQTIYPTTANVPHTNPWNTVAGRRGTANIPAGGSVTAEYTAHVGAAPVVITITIPAVAVPGKPATPTVQWNVTGGTMAHTHHITQSGQDFDIAINFS
jgi:hypothetical protein